MPITTEMIREFVDEGECFASFKDFNQGGDCEQCGREDVWLNFKNECRDCSGKAEKEEVRNGNANN